MRGNECGCRTREWSRFQGVGYSSSAGREASAPRSDPFLTVGLRLLRPRSGWWCRLHRGAGSTTFRSRHLHHLRRRVRRGTPRRAWPPSFRGSVLGVPPARWSTPSTIATDSSVPVPTWDGQLSGHSGSRASPLPPVRSGRPWSGPPRRNLRRRAGWWCSPRFNNCRPNIPRHDSW